MEAEVVKWYAVTPRLRPPQLHLSNISLQPSALHQKSVSLRCRMRYTIRPVQPYCPANKWSAKFVRRAFRMEFHDLHRRRLEAVGLSGPRPLIITSACFPTNRTFVGRLADSCSVPSGSAEAYRSIKDHALLCSRFCGLLAFPLFNEPLLWQVVYSGAGVRQENSSPRCDRRTGHRPWRASCFARFLHKNANVISSPGLKGRIFPEERQTSHAVAVLGMTRTMSYPMIKGNADDPKRIKVNTGRSR